MKSLKEYLVISEFAADNPVPGDVFAFELSTDSILETVVEAISNDGDVLLEMDEQGLNLLIESGALLEDSNMPVAQDSTSPIHGELSPIWGGNFTPYNRKHDSREWMRKDVDLGDEEVEHGTVPNGGTVHRVDDPAHDANVRGVKEAKYHGREVPLGKRMKGDVKKSKVYVRKPNGNIVKVNFGDKTMRIKKSNPKRRKSFRARHNCANPGPRWKARYWSCRAW